MVTNPVSVHPMCTYAPVYSILERSVQGID